MKSIDRKYMGGNGPSLISTAVSNPYTFTLESNINSSASINQFTTANLSGYAQRNIPNYQSVTSIPKANLDYLQSGLKATDVSGMFNNCYKLSNIPKLGIDTSSCTNFQNVFSGCSSLTSLDISEWNSSNVTNMSQMFIRCQSLTSLDLRNFNVSKVTNMNETFDECSSLVTIDISSWDTSSVNNFYCIFYGCYNLTTINGVLDLRSVGTDSHRIQWMFDGCTKLYNVKIKNINKAYFEKYSGLKSNQYTIVS